MINCGCKKPNIGPEPHSPVPLHRAGFFPNAIEWLKKAVDKLGVNKADKKVPSSSGNLAALDNSGNLVDSGKKSTDFEASGAVDTHNTASDPHPGKFDDIGAAAAVKTELEEVISQLDILKVQLVDVLPDTGVSKILYLVKKSSGSETGDERDEYVWVDGKFEKIGSTKVDITGKADKVTGATNGNIAVLGADGNLADSGKKPSDFASAADLDNLTIADTDKDKRVAIGVDADASGDAGESANTRYQSVAVGREAKATSAASVAVGPHAETLKTDASDQCSVAVGYRARTNSYGAIAVGSAAGQGLDTSNPKSTGANSVAIGRFTSPQAEYSVAIGQEASVAPDAKCAVQIGLGENTEAYSLKFRGTTLVKDSRVPVGSVAGYKYCRLDKLHFSGGRYIDTGVQVPSGDFTLKMKCALKRQPFYRALYGCRTDASINTFCALVNINSTEVFFDCGVRGNYRVQTGINKDVTDFDITASRVGNTISYKYSYDGKTYTTKSISSDGSLSSGLTILVGALNNSSDKKTGYEGDVYSFSIENASGKIIDLVPFDKDGAIGMLDTVSGKMFGNANTGVSGFELGDSKSAGSLEDTIDQLDGKIPTKVSELANDRGYQTSQSLADYAKTADVVPNGRKVNGKELNADVTLTGNDIKVNADSNAKTISTALSGKLDVEVSLTDKTVKMEDDQKLVIQSTGDLVPSVHIRNKDGTADYRLADEGDLNDAISVHDGNRGAHSSLFAGRVPISRKINSKQLNADVTLTGADIAVSGSDATKISAALDGKIGQSGGVVESLIVYKSGGGGEIYLPGGEKAKLYFGSNLFSVDDDAGTVKVNGVNVATTSDIPDVSGKLDKADVVSPDSSDVVSGKAADAKVVGELLDVWKRGDECLVGDVVAKTFTADDDSGVTKIDPYGITFDAQGGQNYGGRIAASDVASGCVFTLPGESGTLVAVDSNNNLPTEITQSLFSSDGFISKVDYGFNSTTTLKDKCINTLTVTDNMTISAPANRTDSSGTKYARDFIVRIDVGETAPTGYTWGFTPEVKSGDDWSTIKVVEASKSYIYRFTDCGKTDSDGNYILMASRVEVA